MSAAAALRFASLRMIIAAAAESFDLRESDVLSDLQSQPHVRARYAACLMARELTTLTQDQIGIVLGRHHSTVNHAERRAEELRQTDVDFRIRYEGAKAAIFAVANLKFAERLRDCDPLQVARAMFDQPKQTPTSWELLSVAARFVALHEFAGSAFQLLADLDRLVEAPRDARADTLRTDLKARITSVAEQLAALGYANQPEGATNA